MDVLLSGRDEQAGDRIDRDRIEIGRRERIDPGTSLNLIKLSISRRRPAM